MTDWCEFKCSHLHVRSKSKAHKSPKKQKNPKKTGLAETCHTPRPVITKLPPWVSGDFGRLKWSPTLCRLTIRSKCEEMIQ